MSAKTSHRRTAGTVKCGGRVEHVELEMKAWVVVGSTGFEHVVYTLGETPQGFRRVLPRGEL